MTSRIPRWSALMSLALLGSAPARALAQAPPALLVQDVTVPETNGGPFVATFVVAFLDPRRDDHGSVTVVISTTGGTATAGTSCGGAGVDYVGLNNFTLALDSTEKRKLVNITVCGDARDEPDETFVISLLRAQGAAIQDGQAQATIIDDDPPPSLRVNDVMVAEGAAGTVATAVFTVTVTGASQNPISVQFATANGSAIGGRCGKTDIEANADPRPSADYAPTSGTLSFAPNLTGQTLASVTTVGTTKEIRVPVCSDDSIDGNEQFTVRLSNPVNATIARGTGTATIR